MLMAMLTLSSLWPCTERPTFIGRPGHQRVLVDKDVEFRCQVQGDPHPIVHWRKEDGDLPSGR